MNTFAGNRFFRKGTVLILALSLCLAACAQEKKEAVPKESKGSAVELRVPEEAEKEAGKGTSDAGTKEQEEEIRTEEEKEIEKEKEKEIVPEEEEIRGGDHKDSVKDSAVYDAEEKADSDRLSDQDREKESGSASADEGEVVIPSGESR